MKPRPISPARSLRRLLRRQLLAALIPLLLVSAGVAYYAILHFAGDAYDRSLARRALALADRVRVEAGQPTLHLPEAALAVLEFDPNDVLYYTVLAPDGRRLGGNAHLDLPKEWTGRRRLAFFDSEYDDMPVRLAVYTLPLTGTRARGEVRVLAAETLDKRRHLAEEALLVMGFPLLVMTALTLHAVNLGVRRSLKSVDALRRALQSRPPGTLDPIQVEALPDELAPLLGTLNRLLEDIRRLQKHNRAFIADVAHQLRTPMAGLQAEIQLMADTGEACAERLTRMQSLMTRQNRLIAQLIALSRAENPDTEWSRIDLVHLAREVARDWAPVLARSGVELAFETSLRQALCSGEPFLLSEALGNLLDNVARHSAATRARMYVGQDDDVVWVGIADDGIGVPADERARLGRRFVRGKAAQAEGSGLGLAIVTQCVQAHGGGVRLEEGIDGRGLGVRVCLPRLYEAGGWPSPASP